MICSSEKKTTKHGLMQKAGQSCMRDGPGKGLVAGKDGLRAGHHKTAEDINLKSKITFTSLPDIHSRVRGHVHRHTYTRRHTEASLLVLQTHISKLDL